MLKEGSIDVWSVDLKVAEQRIDPLAEVLSDRERERAAGFMFADHRRRFIASHYAVRRVLAAYCDISPCVLQFREGTSGKPALVADERYAGLEFNLSHSQDLAVIAVASQDPVGVDIEYLHEVPDLEAIAARWFAPVEYDELMRIPQDRRPGSFLSLWTRKEAYVKVVDGLSTPLDKFVVSLDSSRPTPVDVVDDGLTLTDWWIHPLPSVPGYVGAVAARGANRKLSLRSLEL